MSELQEVYLMYKRIVFHAIKKISASRTLISSKVGRRCCRCSWHSRSTI